MGSIPAILLGLLKLANALASWLSDRQLIGAGQAEAIASQAQGVVENMEKARRAADAITHPENAAADDYARRLRGKYSRPEE